MCLVLQFKCVVPGRRVSQLHSQRLRWLAQLLTLTFFLSFLVWFRQFSNHVESPTDEERKRKRGKGEKKRRRPKDMEKETLTEDNTRGGSCEMIVSWLTGECISFFFHVEQVRVLMEQMMTAVSFIHGRHIIHRDVKPDNFMLDGSITSPDVVVKLGDFGLVL